MSHPIPENAGNLGRIDRPDDALAHSGDSGSSKADAAKEQGMQIKDDALEGGRHIAGVAAEEGQSVVTEAGDQAKDLLDQARSQLASQAVVQQQNLTTWLRSLADELHQMVDNTSAKTGDGPSGSTSGGSTSASAPSGVATNAVTQAQARVQDAADWLEKHEPSELMDEATRFARRRPGAFLAIAAVGGLLAGRFTRGLKADASSESAPTSGVGDTELITPRVTTPAPAYTAPVAPGPAYAAPVGPGSTEWVGQEPR